jgi:poly-gamma-glutamate capsule biosynthesis protein CapA/YwtB (metallophosphatase superfamily)
VAVSLRWLAWAALAVAVGGCARSAPRGEVTVACVGDVMLGRGVARACQVHGPDYPFAEVAPVLRRADLAFGNLEGSLGGRETRFPRVNALLAGPEMAPALARAGFGVLSLANNHAIDGGRAGLRKTLAALQAAGITAVGAGRTAAEAEAGTVRNVRGLRIGFLAFSDFPYTNFVQDADRETVLQLSEDNLRRLLPPLRRRCEVLIVSLHWGQEGVRAVSSYQRRLAHLAADLGAAVVFGHHPHVRGPVEAYHGALIAYDLGNLVFDDQSYGGNEGAILMCRVSKQGVQSHQLIATRVEDCRAVPAKPGTAALRWQQGGR